MKEAKPIDWKEPSTKGQTLCALIDAGWSICRGFWFAPDGTEYERGTSISTIKAEHEMILAKQRKEGKQ